MWSGAEDDIPEGWTLCNGENGTPDLRGRFVLGASESHAMQETGGEETHKLLISELPTNRINISWYTAVGNYTDRPRTAGNGTSTKGYTQNVGGSDRPHNNMPPFYVLCFIMKV